MYSLIKASKYTKSKRTNIWFILMNVMSIFYNLAVFMDTLNVDIKMWSFMVVWFVMDLFEMLYYSFEFYNGRSNDEWSHLIETFWQNRKFIASDNISECVAGDLPIVISCASLALADAGIMMYDLVASVSVVWILLTFAL